MTPRVEKVGGTGHDHWRFDTTAGMDGQIIQTVVPEGCVRATCGRHSCVTIPGRLNLPCDYGGWCRSPLRAMSDKRHTADLADLHRPPAADIVIRFKGGPL